MAVVEASSFEAGLRAVRDAPVDIVLLDSLGAAATGKQVRALRDAVPGVKVIVLSGDPAPEELLAAIREHAFAYFRRPFDPAEVKAAVARALGAPDWEDGIELISARPDWISLRLRCRRSTADRVLSFLAELRVDLPAEDREDIGTAVREILLNAIEHGGGLDPRKRVQVSRLRTQRLILYHVQDPGSGFSLDALPHAAVSNPPEDPTAHMRHREHLGLRAGGFGILVTHSLVDELIYSESGNEAILIKYLDAPAPARAVKP